MVAPIVQDTAPSEPELTVRGLILGAAITIVFTAANVYLGLKVGLTFASAIPAAVISMAALRVLGKSGLLENNIVKTQASAAGTLSSVIFVLPGLLMVGYWHGFPFWQSAAVCVAGGVLGVLFTIPLRRAMVVGSDLPFPEGVAAAEILRVGVGHVPEGEPGAADIAAGGLIAAAMNFGASGLHVLSDGLSVWLHAGSSIFRLSTGFSLALLGAGYLIGLYAGLAMLLGAVISWGIAVPVLTAMHPMPAGGDMATYATLIWAQKVRFIGAGVIGIAAIWSLAGLAGPTIEGMRSALAGMERGGRAPKRTEQDMKPAWMGILLALSLLVIGAAFFMFVSEAASLANYGVITLVLAGTLFAAVFGFLVAAACGYMAGLVGSSSSPISGIGILATIGGSLLVLAMFGARLDDETARSAAIAFVLFAVSVVLATATISNDNLQDLKTGYLLGATPWRQQVALVLGCVVGGLAIPPILDLLYTAYGFPGAMPRAGMDPTQVLAAPQATLMAKIATGILGGTLEWAFIGIGAALSVAMIAFNTVLDRINSSIFSFEGRFGRAHYWGFLLLCSILSGCFQIAFVLAKGDRGISPLSISFLVVELTIVWIALATCTKRCHDLNLSAWFALTLFIPFINILALIGLGVVPGSAAANEYGVADSDASGGSGSRARLPVLAVGIGLYLPPTVGVTLGIGAVLGWWVERGLRGRPDAEQAGRRGVLIASGFIVGESLVGVAMAAVIGATGNQAPLALAGAGFAPTAAWITLALFAAVAVWMARRVRGG